MTNFLKNAFASPEKILWNEAKDIMVKAQETEKHDYSKAVELYNQITEKTDTIIRDFPDSKLALDLKNANNTLPRIGLTSYKEPITPSMLHTKIRDANIKSQGETDLLSFMVLIFCPLDFIFNDLIKLGGFEKFVQIIENANDYNISYNIFCLAPSTNSLLLDNPILYNQTSRLFYRFLQYFDTNKSYCDYVEKNDKQRISNYITEGVEKWNNNKILSLAFKISKNPEIHPRALISIAKAYANKEQLDESCTVLDEILYRDKELFESAHWIKDMSKDNVKKEKINIFIKIANAYIDINQIEKAADVLQKASQITLSLSSLDLKIENLIEIANIYANINYEAEAAILLKESHQLVSTSTLYLHDVYISSLIDVYANNKQFDKALQLVNAHKNNSHKFTPIITGYAKAGYFDKALDLVKNTECDTESGITAIALVYIKNDNIDAALDLQISYNLPTTNTLCNIFDLRGMKYVKDRQLDELLEFAKTYGSTTYNGNYCKPNKSFFEDTFVALVSFYIQNKQYDKIIEFANYIGHGESKYKSLRKLLDIYMLDKKYIKALEVISKMSSDNSSYEEYMINEFYNLIDKVIATEPKDTTSYIFDEIIKSTKFVKSEYNRLGIINNVLDAFDKIHSTSIELLPSVIKIANNLESTEIKNILLEKVACEYIKVKEYEKAKSIAIEISDASLLTDIINDYISLDDYENSLEVIAFIKDEYTREEMLLKWLEMDINENITSLLPNAISVAEKLEKAIELMLSIARLYANFDNLEKAINIINGLDIDDSQKIANLLCLKSTTYSNLPKLPKLDTSSAYSNYASKLYAKYGEVNKALELVSKLEDESEKNEVYIEIAKFYLINNEVDKALELVTKVENESEKNEVYIEIAKFYLINNEVDKALELVTKVENENENEKNEVYIEIAKLYLINNEDDKANEIIVKLNELNKAELFSMVAEHYLIEENIEKFNKFLTKTKNIVKSNGLEYPTTVHIMAIVKKRIQFGEYEEAFLLIKEFFEVFHFDLILLFIKVKEYKKALHLTELYLLDKKVEDKRENYLEIKEKLANFDSFFLNAKIDEVITLIKTLNSNEYKFETLIYIANYYIENNQYIKLEKICSEIIEIVKIIENMDLILYYDTTIIVIFLQAEKKEMLTQFLLILLKNNNDYSYTIRNKLDFFNEYELSINPPNPQLKIFFNEFKNNPNVQQYIDITVDLKLKKFQETLKTKPRNQDYYSSLKDLIIACLNTKHEKRIYNILFDIYESIKHSDSIDNEEIICIILSLLTLSNVNNRDQQLKLLNDFQFIDRIIEINGEEIHSPINNYKINPHNEFYCCFQTEDILLEDGFKPALLNMKMGYQNPNDIIKIVTKYLQEGCPKIDGIKEILHEFLIFNDILEEKYLKYQYIEDQKILKDEADREAELQW